MVYIVLGLLVLMMVKESRPICGFEDRCPRIALSFDVSFTYVCYTRRHWVRVELSTILIKYAFKISIQFWSRRDNSVVPLA